MSRLNKAPKFLFKCTDCDYHAPIKGLWAVITRYADDGMYSFLCAVCDMKHTDKRKEAHA
jgi:hypothetical protein